MLQGFISFLLSICVFSLNAQSFQSSIDSIVHRYNSQGGFNGVILIATDTGNMHCFQYGFRDLHQKKENITSSDKFDLASLTKQFTGLCILKLINEGHITAEDQIGKYFPELSPALQKVTVRQLANHTSGIHDFYSLTKRHDSLNKNGILNLLSLLDSTVFEPGTKWGYTNSGYFLLGLLVERVSKTSFEDYCSNNVLHPLGMTAFSFQPDKDTVLTGYTSKLEKVRFNSFVSGQAGLYLSARDFITYYKTVSNDCGYWRNLFALSYQLADSCNEKGWTYGFGWYFTSDNVGLFRAHSGRNDGTYNYIRWYEDSGVFICMLSNKNDSFIKDLREELSTFVTNAK